MKIMLFLFGSLVKWLVLRLVVIIEWFVVLISVVEVCDVYGFSQSDISFIVSVIIIVSIVIG